MALLCRALLDRTAGAAVPTRFLPASLFRRSVVVHDLPSLGKFAKHELNNPCGVLPSDMVSFQAPRTKAASGATGWKVPVFPFRGLRPGMCGESDREWPASLKFFSVPKNVRLGEFHSPAMKPSRS